MEARINFALPSKMKRDLDDLARKTSVLEKRNISNGELIRRALVSVYKVGLKTK